MILIGFTEPDRQVASAIAAECDRQGLEHRLDPRDDWLSQALRGFAGASHAVVVVSNRNAESWWLPFWVGRVVEQGIPLTAYTTEPQQALPSFLAGVPSVCADPGELAARLEAGPPGTTRR